MQEIQITYFTSYELTNLEERARRIIRAHANGLSPQAKRSHTLLNIVIFILIKSAKLNPCVQLSYHKWLLCLLKSIEANAPNSIIEYLVASDIQSCADKAIQLILINVYVQKDKKVMMQQEINQIRQTAQQKLTFQDSFAKLYTYTIANKSTLSEGNNDLWLLCDIAIRKYHHFGSGITLEKVYETIEFWTTKLGGLIPLDALTELETYANWI